MIRPTRKISSLFLSLALLAFLVRSIIPVGFMPGKGGSYPLVICSAAGAVTINVPADKIPHAPEHHSADNMPCSFAQAFAQGMLTAQPELPQPLLASSSIPDYTEIHLSLQVIVKDYFAQGPPHSLV